MYTAAQTKAIVFIPVGTGCISFIASGALIVMILFFSKIKLSAACRRIVFGLCVYNIFLSLSSAASTAPVPVNQGLYGASGNVATCDVQGFFLHMGSTGSILYNVSLSVYYVSVIKFNIKEKAFWKVELWCHLVPNVFAISTSIFLLTHQYFNSIGNTCWISSSPMTCLANPDIPCIRGDTKAVVYRKWLALYVAPVGFAVITINMLLIIHTVLVQKRKSDRWRFGTINSNGESKRLSLASIFQIIRKRFCSYCRCGGKNGECNQRTDGKNKLTLPLRSSLVLGDPVIPSSIEARLELVEISRNVADKNGRPFGSGDPVSRPKASRSRTADDPYTFNISKVRSTIGRESILNVNQENQGISKARAISSRSGTADDPYAFNIGKVRTSIRRESILKDRAAASKPGDADDPHSFKLGKIRSPNRRASTGTFISTSTPGFDLDKASRNSSLTHCVSLPELVEALPSNANNHDKETKMEEEVISQALLYILAYVITFIFPVISRMITLNNSRQVPFLTLILSRIFMPLQGFFVICVYTRPHVKSIRKNNPDYSWFKAFWITFKAGGDNDSAGQSHGSTRIPMSDTEKMKRQERIRKDFQRRMSTIGERRNSMSDSNCAPISSHVISDKVQRRMSPIGERRNSMSDSNYAPINSLDISDTALSIADDIAKCDQNEDDVEGQDQISNDNGDGDKMGELEIQSQSQADEELGGVVLNDASAGDNGSSDIEWQQDQ